jgi:putative transposase
LNRCIRLHPDGRIYGWRALRKNNHTGDYVRTAAPSSGKTGKAGQFTQFLRDHPEIERSLQRYVLEDKGKSALLSARHSHQDSYVHFRRECIAAGISSARYPFNAKDGGRRAIRRYCLDLLRRHFSILAGKVGGPDARQRSRIGQGIAARWRSTGPFDAVMLDAHKMNFISCVGIPRAYGIDVVPIERLNLLLTADEHSTAILGYHVAVGEPSAFDVVQALRAALTPWKPRKLLLPEHKYPEGAGLPSGLIPECAGLAWNTLFLDNAMVHRANLVCEKARKHIGCAVNFGPVGRWDRRPLIESLFSMISRSAFLRLCNSTGTGPGDPTRPKATRNAIKYELLYEEMLDFLDIVICTYNARPRDHLGGLSPLSVLSDALLCAPTRWLPRKLPNTPERLAHLGISVEELPVRGSLKSGTYPYVQFLGARYSSPLLAQAYELIGQRIRVHIDEDDIRSFKAFLPTGEEFGYLTAPNHWSQSAHTRQVRREILSAAAKSEFVIDPLLDTVTEFAAAQARKVVREQRERGSKPPKVSREATALARLLKNTQLAPPVVLDTPQSPAESPSAPRRTRTPSPSFLPKLRHRGVQK